MPFDEDFPPDEENENLPLSVEETQPVGIHPSVEYDVIRRQLQQLRRRVLEPIYDDRPEGRAVEHSEEIVERMPVERENLGCDSCQDNSLPVMQDSGSGGEWKRPSPAVPEETLNGTNAQLANTSNVPEDVNCPVSMPPPTANDTDESISGDQLMAAGGSQTDGRHSSNNKKKKNRKKKKKKQRAIQADPATSLDAEVASEDEPEASTDESHHNSSVAYASDTEQKLHEPVGEEGTREHSAALDSKEVGPKKE